MGTNSLPNSDSLSATHLGVGKALLMGHLLITLPITIVTLLLGGLGIIIGPIIGPLLQINSPTVFVLIVVITVAVMVVFGSALGWLWWSYTIPRWRKWALANGAPADKLHRWAVATALEWPKGWIFEKTEFKVKD